MDYTKLKTRLKDKFTKEYKKTKHTDAYLEAEVEYKKARESVKMMEMELQALLQAFTASSIYENITSSLASGFEMVKETLKKQNRQRTEVSKEEADVFGLFAGSSQALASNTKGDVSRQFEALSYSLKKVSASRVQLKDGLTRVMDTIKELKDTSLEIDDNRLRILDIRQCIESSKSAEEEEKYKQDYTESISKVYEDMKGYTQSHELSEIALGLVGALRSFFGDAYDAMAENINEK
ncbi:hypothetical protein NEPAR06_0346 [Nematocida parisii]|uniref:BAR domain-containing protein n=1 Tax=Nematocida parisii (strain ERTm3) TaxID=935791 RepID=I3EGA0_NEMP3|nr:uncharacterized protein NEPG_01259 [Nematocida parisii ERTm1]EIJ88247.1 hypothetical protein NEQG_01691 [Nematocida parisii ERTm3]KAI5125378.1 hypothetical protein NEPAR03_0053 [Nematocida parisii]EIJ93687.1 hypothetical protein NEPG_01259 [Nematocida parisii ERTm1]KAI5125502.1 hypothetical protein NEPAR08_0053 [Nematocida parisii]KAI5140616.1 hypothetical protein NEPAR04_0357 [Nematocida parisii]|eukprot:XP_013059087.1 hypothetical protein NEPG_01259 [Nematocida parisii ERTm1]